MKFLIIGGNATGMSAASRLRKNMPNASITVLEKGNLVSFGACGLPYFVAGEFENSENMIARSLEAFQKSNIDVKLHHEALHIDPKTKTVKVFDSANGKELTLEYDKALISSGATPFLPSIKGINLKNVHTLTKMEDGTALRESLKTSKEIVIIGGGFIGLETAEAMIHQGKKVTVIEMESRVSGRVFDPEMTEHLQKALINHGVNLVLEEKVQSIEGSETVQAVQTDKGLYNADLVIIATGFIPATQWCKESGFNMLPNGALIIDDQCHTNFPDIFAGGDCASVKHAVTNKNHYIPLATSANKLGRLLGDLLAEKEQTFQGTLGSSALRFMNFEIGRTGLSEHEAQSFGINYAVNIIKDFNHTNYVPGQTALHIKLIYNKDSRILLGGQICGEKDAVLRVDILAVAIFKKMTVDELGMMDFIYAPPFARTWEALNIAGNTCK